MGVQHELYCEVFDYCACDALIIHHYSSDMDSAWVLFSYLLGEFIDKHFPLSPSFCVHGGRRQNQISVGVSIQIHHTHLCSKVSTDLRLRERDDVVDGKYDEAGDV